MAGDAETHEGYYLVTRKQTVTVVARSAGAARQIGAQIFSGQLKTKDFLEDTTKVEKVR